MSIIMVANINVTTQKQCKNYLHACELETHTIYTHVNKYVREKLFVNLKTMIFMLIFMYKAELITLFIICAIVILLFLSLCYLIKGRHSSSIENNTTSTNSSQININFGGSEEKSNSNNGVSTNRNVESTLIQDIQNYNDRNDIDTWFTVFENVMEKVDKTTWHQLLLNKFGLRHFDRISDFKKIIQKENAYELLKSELLNIFGKSKIESQAQSASFGRVMMRRQMLNETTQAYGKDLKRMVQELMPSIDWSQHNDSINQLFIQNLLPGDVQTAVNYAYTRAKAKGNFLILDELIAEANTEEQHLNGMIALKSSERLVMAVTINDVKNEPGYNLRQREYIDYSESSRKRSKEPTLNRAQYHSYNDTNAQLPNNNNFSFTTTNTATNQQNPRTGMASAFSNNILESCSASP